MPNGTFAPRGAVALEIDARAWAGVTLFSGPSAVALASSVTYFDDVLALLTGRGSDTERSFSADMAANGTGAGNWSAGIDEDDRIYVENDAEAFDVLAGAGNAVFGFDTAGQSAVLVSGTTYRATATGDWTRGTITNQQIQLDPASAGAFTCPSYAYQAHTIPILMRARGNADADDNYATTCLEAVDNDANDDPGSGGDNRIRWGVTADGFVYRARPTGVAAAPTWATTDAAKDFRKALGFTGAEAEATVGGLEVLTASTRPARGLLTPSRPFERVEGRRAWSGDAVQLTGGAAAYATVDDLKLYDVAMYLDGAADRIDQARHYLDGFRPYWAPGQLANVYQDWGDGRRTLRGIDVGAGQAAYDELYTSQRDGEFGRLRVRIAVDAPTEAAVRWPGRLRRRVPVTMTFTEREG